MHQDLDELSRELNLRVGTDVQQSAVDQRRRKLLVFAEPQHGGEVRQALAELGAADKSYELYEGEFRAIASLPPAVSATPAVFARPGARLLPEGGREGVLSCLVQDQNGQLLGLTVEHLFRIRNGEAVNNGVGRLGKFEKDGGLGANGTASADCAVFSLDPGVAPAVGQFPAPVGFAGLPRTVNQAVHRQDAPARTARVVRADFTARYKIGVAQNIAGVSTLVQKKVFLPNQILIEDVDQIFAVPRDSGVLILMSRGHRSGGFAAGAPLAICTSMFENGLYYTASPIAACLDLLDLAGLA